MDGSVISTLLLLAMGAVFGGTVTFLVLAFWAADQWAKEQEEKLAYVRRTADEMSRLGMARPADGALGEPHVWKVASGFGGSAFDQNNPNRYSQ